MSKNCPLAALRWSWKSQRASLPTQIFQTYVTLLRHAYLRHCTCFYIFWYQAFWPLGVLNCSFIGYDLASHWEFLAAVLNTDKNGWWLGVIIATFMLLLQTVCACICTFVCAVLFTVLISLRELRHYLNCFGASWEARQEKKPEYGKKPTPPCEMSAHLPTLLLVINGRGKCPTDIKGLTHTWLNSGRIFHSVWAGQHFIGG